MQTTARNRSVSEVGRRAKRTVVAAAVLASAPAWTLAQSSDAPAVETLRLTPIQMSTNDSYFGTVRARDLSSLSYEARGCVIEVSEDAKTVGEVAAGHGLLRLDDQRAQLAVRTAEARVLELQAAMAERELAVAAAIADEKRRKEDLAFVEEEFQRNSVMLGRGLINESTMETIERRFMEARFTAERAIEAIANAEAAKNRAEIALQIGQLEVDSAGLNLDDLQIMAPFDGVLVGFDANVGDCVQEGELAAQIFRPDQKSVDVFFPISRLASQSGSGLTVGQSVTVTRVNGDTCGGTITQLDADADAETQFVEATVDVDAACAPSLFLNEAVEIEATQSEDDSAFAIPSTAIQGAQTVFLVDEVSNQLVSIEAEILSRSGPDAVAMIPGGAGRLLVTLSEASMTDGQAVRSN
ncbi:MAG: HlyD family efflux transporter periplasmic adaptor subunit [Pseudomonadota bacterium]